MAFEVIVATERLEDGSGLELLGQISKKWPSVSAHLSRRIGSGYNCCAGGWARSSCFKLSPTLSTRSGWSQRLRSLMPPQHADADTSDIQQIELSGETPAEEPQVTEPMEFGESFESEASGDFPAPRPTAPSCVHGAGTGRFWRKTRF